VLDVASKIFEEPATRSSQQRKNVAFAPANDSNTKTTNDADNRVVDTPQPNKKRPREEDEDEAQLLPTTTLTTINSIASHAVTPIGATTSQQPTNSYYWQSREALNLFKPRPDDCDAKDALVRRVKRLSLVNKSDNAWRDVVYGRDPHNICTSKNDVFEIRQRAAFHCIAYQYALEKMNSWTSLHLYLLLFGENFRHDEFK
jgi:hypothetical protein